MTQRRIWRALDADLFRFTATDLRDLHIALMSGFEATSVMSPALDIDGVRRALTEVGYDEPVDDATVVRALGSLTDWKLVEAIQNHAAHYASPEDFERRNLLWSLTRRGEAAIAGVLRAFDEMRSAVGLQPAVLDAIGDRLFELSDVLGTAGGDTDARIHILLAEIENHLAALVASVRQFNGHLQALLRDDGTDDVVFIDVKRRTVAYLEEYVDGVEQRHRRLRSALERLDRTGLAVLFDRALTGANLAPMATGDPGPDWIAERRHRWSAVEAWFAPDGGERAQILGLLDVARTAIVELLRVLERRWDQRRRSASVASDLRRLATWFADASTDTEAHDLFGVAFGLWSSRHAHLVPIDGEARSPRFRWGETTPVDVAPTLRTSGSLANRGRVRPLADPTAVRARRQREQAEAFTAHHAVRAALATDGAVRLSTFVRLPDAEFGELLRLLSLALEAEPGTDSARRAMSLDGQVEIELWPPRGGGVARLGTDSGVLSGPDFLVSITVHAGVVRTPTTRPSIEAAHGA